MTDDTASERVERWTVDRPDYCCPNCGGSDIGPLTVHAGDYVGVYWCPDCSCEIPEPPQVEVIPVAPLLSWLDDLIERHTQGPLGAECSAAREGAELHIGIYEFVKAHIEGRDTHDERPDKCPTCGIAREHDGPHYRAALKQAGKPMCPDPFHDAVSGAIDTPSPDKVRGILRDEVVMVGGEPHIPLGEPHIPLEVANRRLHEVERERDTLREAVEACAEAFGAWEMSSKPSDPTIAQGLLRAGDKARRALASLDEQGGSDE